MEQDANGLHSLRARGASAAANAGVEDQLFKRHRRWRSENAKDGYVKDSYESRLSVSLNHLPPPPPPPPPPPTHTHTHTHTIAKWVGYMHVYHENESQAKVEHKCCQLY